jgi:fibronectin type 3 domain-containing protein
VNAQAELQRIIEDEKRQPITYNHYYTDNIQNARHHSLRDAIQKAMKAVVAEDWNGKFHISNNQLDSEKLLASLQKRVVVNMDDQACSEALAGLAAYYKVYTTHI